MHGVAVTCDRAIATGEERLGDMVFDSAQELSGALKDRTFVGC